MFAIIIVSSASFWLTYVRSQNSREQMLPKIQLHTHTPDDRPVSSAHLPFNEYHQIKTTDLVNASERAAQLIRVRLVSISTAPNKKPNPIGYWKSNVKCQFADRTSHSLNGSQQQARLFLFYFRRRIKAKKKTSEYIGLWAIERSELLTTHSMLLLYFQVFSARDAKRNEAKQRRKRKKKEASLIVQTVHVIFSNFRGHHTVCAVDDEHLSARKSAQYGACVCVCMGLV